MARPKARSVTVKGTFAAACSGCTQEEAAAIMGVSEATFKRRLGQEPLLREAWESGHAAMRADIRMQQRRIMRGNGPGAAAMAMRLGEIYLGQTPKSIVEHTGSIALEGAHAANTFAAGIDPYRWNDDERAEFAVLCDTIDALGGAPLALPPSDLDRFFELIRKAKAEQRQDHILALPPPGHQHVDLYEELEKEAPPESDDEIKDEN
jgi:hypothetical protein